MPYVEGTREELSFAPRRAARLLDAGGTQVGLLEMGEIELLFTADSITATFTTGEREPPPRLFELCGEPGCGGAMGPANRGAGAFCMLDATHDLTRRRVVRLAFRFMTVGLRLADLPAMPQAHSLLHGLRAGLEQVAGVPVRSIGEHMTTEEAFLLDTEAGGMGACELLLDPGEDYRNLRTALDVATSLAECPCDDGCPQCLYQYGCAERNTPNTLSRRARPARRGYRGRVAGGRSPCSERDRCLFVGIRQRAPLARGRASARCLVASLKGGYTCR